MSKGNTLFERMKEGFHRLDEHQDRQPVYALRKSSDKHTCDYCGETFVGRFCPQCGSNCERSRMTFRNVIMNVLDVWGLGNRPMFRTIRELFWRPGYMMRDYLRGRQMAYFPPVKLLFLLAMFMLFEAKLLGIRLTTHTPIAELTQGEDEPMPEEMVAAWQSINEIANMAVNWIMTHPAQMVIIECMVLIFIIARVFRNSPGFGSITRTESFFVQIYIECQSFCVLMLAMPFYVLAHREQDIALNDFTGAIAPLNVLLLFIDSKQLFQFGFWKTLWKIIKIYLILFTIILAIIFVIGIGVGIFMMSKANVL